MKITDLKCAVIGQNPVVRVVTDEGVDGYGDEDVRKILGENYLRVFAQVWR